MEPKTYSTPSIFFSQSDLPNQMANFSILSPHHLAARKWPSSWTIIRMLKRRMTSRKVTTEKMKASRPWRMATGMMTRRKKPEKTRKREFCQTEAGLVVHEGSPGGEEEGSEDDFSGSEALGAALLSGTTRLLFMVSIFQPTLLQDCHPDNYTLKDNLAVV